MYRSKFCGQEDFVIIVSGTIDWSNYSEERKSLRKSSRNFNTIETVYYSKRHSYGNRTVCERSNIWTVCSTLPICGESQIRSSFELIDSFRIHLGKTNQWYNLIKIPDDRFSFSFVHL